MPDYPSQIAAQMRRIEDDANISQHNTQLIQEWRRKAALGNSQEPITVNRYLPCMKRIGRHVDFELDQGSRWQYEELVGAINQYRFWDRDMEPATRKKYKTALSSFARTMGFRDELSFMSIGIKKCEEKDLDPSRFPQEDHISQLRSAVCNPRDRALISMAWCTGGRPSELLELRWGNIEWTHDQDTGRQYISVYPDGKTGGRAIPVFQAREDLERWRKSHPDPGEDQPIFCQLGQPQQISNRAANNQVKQAYRKSQIPDRIHDTLKWFRKGRATHLAREGMNAFQIQRFMGWDSIKTAMYYIELAQVDLVGTIQEIDQAVLEDPIKEQPVTIEV